MPLKAQFSDEVGYYSTALHELGHWTGHETRLNRESGPFGSISYAKEELRAEIGSMMLSSIPMPRMSRAGSRCSRTILVKSSERRLTLKKFAISSWI